MKTLMVLALMGLLSGPVLAQSTLSDADIERIVAAVIDLLQPGHEEASPLAIETKSFELPEGYTIEMFQPPPRYVVTEHIQPEVFRIKRPHTHAPVIVIDPNLLTPDEIEMLLLEVDP